jgi:glycosyltransferase involved in cell wall biosynthesis
MDDLPLVTVGLPVYNGERYIGQSIESILSQTYKDLELIISDNASNDSTEQICRAYASRDARVRYYRADENRGAAWNHNRVVELARGEYFRWQNHDDYSHPNFLDKCLAVVQSDPQIVLCYPQFVRVDEEGRQLGIKTSRILGCGEPAERFQSMIYRRDSCEEIYGITRTAVIRRTALLGAYACSDDTFLAELILHGKFLQIPEPLFYYRIHATQSTKAYPSRSDRMVWFKSSARVRFALPFLHLLTGYVALVGRSPLSMRQKVRCYSVLGEWAWFFRDWFKEDLRVIRVSETENTLVPFFRKYAPWTRPVWHRMKVARRTLRRPESSRARRRRIRREELERWDLTPEE